MKPITLHSIFILLITYLAPLSAMADEPDNTLSIYNKSETTLLAKFYVDTIEFGHTFIKEVEIPADTGQKFETDNYNQF